MKRVMLVDDSDLMRVIQQTHLRAQKFEVVAEARNGVEAIDLFRIHRPEIVTMDITMPHMDGLTCMREILAINPETRIIIITAIDDPAVALRAMESGAYAVLQKPFRASQLTEILKTLA
ncbi:MAG: response regulator [Leptospirales bacterium]|nr:response regulator [Leptospirales bacterium]